MLHLHLCAHLIHSLFCLHFCAHISTSVRISTVIQSSDYICGFLFGHLPSWHMPPMILIRVITGVIPSHDSIGDLMSGKCFCCIMMFCSTLL